MKRNGNLYMIAKQVSIFPVIFFICGLVLSSCVKENSPYISQPEKNLNITITFMHLVDGGPLKFDSLIYKTSSGNHYMINDLQYFVSCIRLHQEGGKWFDPDQGKDIHYVDARVPGTSQWALKATVNEAALDSISFVFGLDSKNNISYRFPDPPERDMSWPEVLGGGYHYMKMNMKWEKPGIPGQQPFMFHVGIGQMYAGNTIDPDSIIGYIPNYFTVSLPFKYPFQPGISQPAWRIIMNIEKWFDGRYAFDFADYPKGIMQNQEGMFKATSNGKDAFDIEFPVK
jgi:hypothetical protein